MTSPVADLRKSGAKVNTENDIEMHPREPSEINLTDFESKPTTFEVTPAGQLRAYSVKKATENATGAVAGALATAGALI